MALRFRQSFKLFPGARVNLSKSGVSVSLGGPGATLNLSSRGVGMTVGVPGTGLSYSTRLSPSADAKTGKDADVQTWSPEPRDRARQVPAPSSSHGDTKHFRSAANDRLTTSSLIDLRDMMLAAINQRSEVERTLAEQAASQAQLVAERGWKGMWLLAWAFRSRLAEIDVAVSECQEAIAECDAWKESSAVAMDFEINEDALEYGESVAEAFAELMTCDKIWDCESESRVNRKKERSAASSALGRTPVEFDFRETSWTRTKAKPLHLQNANGPDLYIFPGFILADGDGEFALLAIPEVNLRLRFSRFVEEEDVPDDAEVIDNTWAKVNRDGSPDRRFKENYEIPVVHYGVLEFSSDTGLNEAFMFSDKNKALKFALAFKLYQAECRGDGSAAKMMSRIEAATSSGDPVKIAKAVGEIVSG